MKKLNSVKSKLLIICTMICLGIFSCKKNVIEEISKADRNVDAKVAGLNQSIDYTKARFLGAAGSVKPPDAPLLDTVPLDYRFRVSSTQDFETQIKKFEKTGGLMYIEENVDVFITQDIDTIKFREQIRKHLIVVKEGKRLTIDGGGIYRIFSLTSKARLEVFGYAVFQNGNSKKAFKGGGAVRVQGYSTAVFVNCLFRDNESLYDKGTTPTYIAKLQPTTYDQHYASAGNGGGAIKVLYSSLELYGCRFYNNKATTGGAVAVTSGNLTASYCDFTNNEALGGQDDATEKFAKYRILAHGSALRVDRAHITEESTKTIKIAGCKFDGNDAHPISEKTIKSMETLTEYDEYEYNASTVELWSSGEQLPKQTDLGVKMWDCNFINNTQGSQRFVLTCHAEKGTSSQTPYVELNDIRIYENNYAIRPLNTNGVDKDRSILDNVFIKYDNGDAVPLLRSSLGFVGGHPWPTR